MVLRYATRVNGLWGIALTKLDVLDTFKEVKLCTGYKLGKEQLHHLPADANEQARLTPIFETMEGWSESTRGARSWADLPANAIK